MRKDTLVVTERIRSWVQVVEMLFLAELLDLISMRVRNLGLWESLSLELLLRCFWVPIRMPSWRNCIRHVILVSNPGVDPGLTGKIISRSWLGMSGDSHKEELEFVARDREETISACYHQEKWREKGMVGKLKSLRKFNKSTE